MLLLEFVLSRQLLWYDGVELLFRMINECFPFICHDVVYSLEQQLVFIIDFVVSFLLLEKSGGINTLLRQRLFTILSNVRLGIPQKLVVKFQMQSMLPPLFKATAMHVVVQIRRRQRDTLAFIWLGR